MAKPKLVFVTQEPHGTYHLAPLTGLGFDIVHLQPAPATPAPGMSVTTDPAALSGAAALVVTGGLTTAFTQAAMITARERNLPVVFVELAYPAEPEGPAPVAPDVVLATTAGGLALYKRYFPATPDFRLARHPALANLPPREPTAKPSILLGTSVSAELPDGGTTLLRYARELAARVDLDITVRAHPREELSLWAEFAVSGGKTLAQDLSSAWAFIAYQSTAFLTSEAMGVPTFYLAAEAWQRTLLPTGYANAQPVGLHTAAQVLARPEISSAPATRQSDWQQLLARYARV